MKKHIIYPLLAGLFISALSCSSEKEQTQQTTPPTPVKVKVGQIENTTSTDGFSTSGKVQASQQASIGTRMMGHVQHIHVSIGEKVSKGQLLITLSNTDLNAKIAQVDAGITEAKAAFTNAEKDYNRFQELYKNESATLKELDDITAHYAMAKARLEGAKQMKQEVVAQLKYTNIRAPFTGLVTSKFVNQGDLANPGMPLLQVENNSSFDVVTLVSESEISKINEGMTVDVLVKSNQNTLHGTVKEVSSSPLHSGSQYQVKIGLNTNTDLYSGMYTQVHFPIAQNTTSKHLTIPTSALVQQGQLDGVYMVSQQNTAVLRWLRLGKQIGDQVEVLSGLNAKDKYILSAESKLENGSPLTVLK